MPLSPIVRAFFSQTSVDVNPIGTLTYVAGTLLQIAPPHVVGADVPSYETLDNESQPQKVYCSIVVKVDGIVTDIIELESKHSYPNVVKEGGNVIVPNDPHAWNDRLFIDVIVSPNVIDDNLSKL